MADVHISPVRTYAGILGALNDIVALGIAMLKATLVLLFFMHVKYAGRLVKLTVIGGFFWLLILFGLTVMDYATRGDVVVDPAPVFNPLLREG